MTLINDDNANYSTNIDPPNDTSVALFGFAHLTTLLIEENYYKGYCIANLVANEIFYRNSSDLIPNACTKVVSSCQNLEIYIQM